MIKKKVGYLSFIYYSGVNSCTDVSNTSCFKLPVPFGITPGSINVAREKFITTKKVMTPSTAGTHNPHWET